MFGNPFDLRDDPKSKHKETPDPFGRLGEDDEPDTEITDIKNLTKLASSVGDNGRNSRRDVAKIEQLLGHAGTLDLKKTDGPTGYWGMRTSDATKAFQKKNGLHINGQINPGGETIRALGKLAAQAVKGAQRSNDGSTPTGSHTPYSNVVTPDLIRGPAHKPYRQQGQPHADMDSRLRGNDDSFEIDDEAFSENQRTARYLASRDGIGEFSKFVADGIETDGDKAIAETVDLYRQTAEMNKTQADALIDKVMPGLSPDNAKRLQAAITPREEDRSQQTHQPSLDKRVEDDFGLKGDIERPQGILPMPDKKDGAWHEPGDVDWTSWTAPEWVHEGAKAVALPKHILDGGAWSQVDATKAALSIGAGGAAARIARGKKPASSAHMASEKASLYDGPQVHRPFEKDYPHGGQNGGKTDESGNLTHDIDGRPLDPQGRIAGRRTVGMGDYRIAGGELDAIATQGTGRVVEKTKGTNIEGDLGRTGYERETKKPTDVLIRDDLRGDDYESVLAHEVGHVIDQYVGEIEVPTSVRKELGDLFNTLNNPRRDAVDPGRAAASAKPITPKDQRYDPDNVDRELMAEAIRGYMVDPSYVKEAAPNVAKLIRKWVNENPNLRKIIQFNAIGGAAVLGAEPDSPE